MTNHKFKRNFTSILDSWLVSNKKLIYVTGPKHVGKESAILRWLKRKSNLVLYAYNENSRNQLINLDECIDELEYKQSIMDENNILVIFNAEELKGDIENCIDYLQNSEKIQCKIIMVANTTKYNRVTNAEESLVVNTLTYEEFRDNLLKIVKDEYISEDYYKIIGGYPNAVLNFIQAVSFRFSKLILVSSVLGVHYRIVEEFIRDITQELYDNKLDVKETRKKYNRIIEELLIKQEIHKCDIIEYLIDTMIIVRDNEKIKFNDNAVFIASVYDRQIYYKTMYIDVSIDSLIKMNIEGFSYIES